MKKYWRLWCLALGQKAGETDRDSDIIAIFRTIIIAIQVIAAIMIMINIGITWYILL